MEDYGSPSRGVGKLYTVCLAELDGILFVNNTYSHWGRDAPNVAIYKTGNCTWLSQGEGSSQSTWDANGFPAAVWPVRNVGVTRDYFALPGIHNPVYNIRLSLVGVTPDKSDILMGTVVIVRGPNIDKGSLMDVNWTTVPVPADGGKRLS